jgi:hypothetical protein
MLLFFSRLKILAHTIVLACLKAASAMSPALDVFDFDAHRSDAPDAPDDADEEEEPWVMSVAKLVFVCAFHVVRSHSECYHVILHQ